MALQTHDKIGNSAMSHESVSIESAMKIVMINRNRIESAVCDDTRIKIESNRLCHHTNRIESNRHIMIENSLYSDIVLSNARHTKIACNRNDMASYLNFKCIGIACNRHDMVSNAPGLKSTSHCTEMHYAYIGIAFNRVDMVSNVHDCKENITLH